MDFHDHTIVLGSGSPRRLRMLQDAGWRVESRPPAIDDGEISIRSGTPSRAVLALTWFKAAQLEVLQGDLVAIAADTICVSDGMILGKPGDSTEARRMLERLQGSVHVTMTGVCILRPGCPRKFLLDRARVEFGVLEESELRSYIDSGEWRGKAGGYNLVDRQAAGWPVRCDGDPDPVMGLPMRRLQPLLARLAEASSSPGGDP
ncbi:MAG: hypothetical protein CMJ34_03675 [Phycisphaerae bacterium]|nr:hypothetical protein [Phycisphaerae bacterium]